MTAGGCGWAWRAGWRRWHARFKDFVRQPNNRDNGFTNLVANCHWQLDAHFRYVDLERIIQCRRKADRNSGQFDVLIGSTKTDQPPL